jgi:hypothetical protein
MFTALFTSVYQYVDDWQLHFVQQRTAVLPGAGARTGGGQPDRF